MWHRIGFEDIAFYHYTVTHSGKVEIRSQYLKTSMYRGKDLYFSGYGSDFFDCLDNFVYNPHPGNNEKLFISKSSKMPRALLRNSDYKIVLDKNAADYIIVPHPGRVIERTTNLIVRYNDIISLIKVSRGYGCSISNDDMVLAVKNAVKATYASVCESVPDLEFHHNTNIEDPIPLFFVKKCDEYLDMLDFDRACFRRYCFDINCRFTPTTEINPENLEFLYRCKDQTIFTKMILGCDWQTYPFTICALLNLYPSIYSHTAIKLVEDAVHFNDFSTSKMAYNNDQEISPEDWNMFQRWVMFHLGVDEEKGGYIDYGNFKERNNKFKKVTNHRVAIRPLYISQPLLSQNIVEMMQ